MKTVVLVTLIEKLSTIKIIKFITSKFLNKYIEYEIILYKKIILLVNANTKQSKIGYTYTPENSVRN